MIVPLTHQYMRNLASTKLGCAKHSSSVVILSISKILTDLRFYRILRHMEFDSKGTLRLSEGWKSEILLEVIVAFYRCWA